MKTNQPVKSEVVKTITSLEIAELTNKRHSHIIRDIRVMVSAFEKEKEVSPTLGWHCESGYYLDSQKKRHTLFKLDKETSITLLSGYDVINRHKIVVRWSQLETERIEEEANPELAIERGNARATKTWLKQGKSEDWIEERIIGIAGRKAFTSGLAQHGVKGGAGFRNCTNAIYIPLYGGTTAVVRMKKNLTAKDNIRDNMNPLELASTRLSELLALNTIQANALNGNAQCEMACTQAAQSVANAIMQNRRASLNQ